MSQDQRERTAAGPGPGIGLETDARRYRVAAVQLNAGVGDIEANNRRAAPFIEEAAGQGARLVVLPEAYSSGYLATAEIWSSAETVNGPTARWLSETSKRLGIYLGTGFVETDGGDFYNSYMISDPRGEIIGVCRKNHAEAYAFRRGNGPHVFRTPMGRMGVGICADNQFAFLPKLMYDESVDIMLMPHAAPLRRRVAREEAGAAEYGAIEAQYARMKNLPRLYAEMLGIPVVFATQLGALRRLPGIIGKAMTPEKWCIPGISRIVDSDGAVKAELGDVEGFAIADVALDPFRKELARRGFGERKRFNGFSALARTVIFPLDGIFARRSYRKSKRKWERGRTAPQSPKPRA